MSVRSYPILHPITPINTPNYTHFEDPAVVDARLHRMPSPQRVPIRLNQPSADQRPTIETLRLRLRPFAVTDAGRVQQLAGHADVAATTAYVPHPYPDGAAEEWIGEHAENFQRGIAVQFAIALKATNELVGCIDLVDICKQHRKAELGYWIGVPYWRRGFCSEAAVALVAFGFDQLQLNKITARHMTINPASGRVMRNAQLKHEGTLRQEFNKGGRFFDIEVYGVLREEFQRT